MISPKSTNSRKSPQITSVKVKISEGPMIRGQLTCNDGTKCYSFRNIPYAEIPEGRLRFAPPEKVKTWSDSDIFYRASQISNEENVLLLNIYTPELKTNESEMCDRAVIVFVPGDLATVKYRPLNFYGPQFLIRHDVVVVNVSYRSGILGFLKFNDPQANAPGDVGLRDLKAAFNWIRKEIGNFGGCPNNITAYGKGLGATHLRHLLKNPMFENCFDKAIFSSCIEHKPREFEFFKDGCYIGRTIANVMSFSHEIATQQNAEFQVDISEKDDLYCVDYLRKLDIDSFNGYNTVITGFIIDDVINVDDIHSITQEVYQSKIPIIIGYNSQESLQDHTIIDENGEINFSRLNDFLEIHGVRNTDPEWDSTFIEWTKHCRKPIYKREMYEKIINSNSPLLEPTNFSSIISYVNGIIVLAKHFASAMSPKNVYLYRFDVNLELDDTQKTDPGSAHKDDLPYIFKNPLTNNNVTQNCDKEKVTKRITTLWTQFAKTGDPNPPEPDELITALWKPVDTKKLSHCFQISNFDVEYCEIPEKSQIEYIAKNMYHMKSDLL